MLINLCFVANVFTKSRFITGFILIFKKKLAELFSISKINICKTSITTILIYLHCNYKNVENKNNTNIFNSIYARKISFVRNEIKAFFIQGKHTYNQLSS